MRDVFAKIYAENGWHSDESRSGRGSTLAETEQIRFMIPHLIFELGVMSVLDIPCGDLNWQSQMTLPAGTHYTGVDIVPELIERNRQQFPGYEFKVLDITGAALPTTDLILCRDLLGHFSNRDVQRALRNIRFSGAKYLLATTFPGREDDGDIETGQWRPINLARLFGLPEPERLINEGCTAGDGKFADKSLGLWRLW